jgi:hypothetical protein
MPPHLKTACVVSIVWCSYCAPALLSQILVKVTFPRRGTTPASCCDALLRADEQAVDVSQFMDDSYAPAPAGDDVIKRVRNLTCTMPGHIFISVTWASHLACRPTVVMCYILGSSGERRSRCLGAGCEKSGSVRLCSYQLPHRPRPSLGNW